MNRRKFDFLKTCMADTNIYRFAYWEDGKQERVQKGAIYIVNGRIAQAKRNGVPTGYRDNNYWETIVEPYNMGDEALGFTEHYDSVTAKWSELDHFYLGKYLEQIKHFTGRDYTWCRNCWNGEESKLRIIESEETENMEVLWIPIEPNEEYTIYMNCATCKIQAGFATEIRWLAKYEGVKDYGRRHYNQPIVVKYDWGNSFTDEQVENGWREYFGIAIQLEKGNKHCIVLKGNYSEKIRREEGDYDPYLRVEHWYDNEFDTPLVDDRLLEFLCGHLVDREQYSKAIIEYQELARSSRFLENLGKTYSRPMRAGVYTTEFQRFMKEVFKDYGIKKNVGVGNKDIDVIMRRLMQ